VLRAARRDGHPARARGPSRDPPRRADGRRPLLAGRGGVPRVLRHGARDPGEQRRLPREPRRSPRAGARRAARARVSMTADVAIASVKALFIILLVLQVMALGVFFERKVSALIQDRIGANRASIFGVAALGLINTLVADPVKFLLKEDVVPASTDRLLHFLAPCLAVIPVLVTFAVVPFGDVLQVAGRTINLQAAELNVGI